MRKKRNYTTIPIVAICLLIVLIAIIGIVNFQLRTTEEPTIENENVKLLFFGKDTYKSSVQSESERIDWNTYDIAPLDMSLTQTFFNDDPYFIINTPGWESTRYSDTVVLYKAPAYIAFTVQETKGALFDKTIDNFSQFEILTRMHETKAETLTIGNYKIQKSVGTCTAETNIIELRQYVSYTFGDGVLQYCFVGVTKYGPDTTVDHLAEAIEDMIQSISFDGLE